MTSGVDDEIAMSARCPIDRGVISRAMYGFDICVEGWRRTWSVRYYYDV